MSKELQTTNTLLWKNNWQQQLTALQINGSTELTEIYRMNTPAICQIVKGEPNKDKGVAVFAAMILSLVKYYGGEWSNSQIMDCATVCYDEWYYISFAELSHFSKRAKRGFFGKIYGSFTPAVLIEWINAYASETDEKRALHYGGIRGTWVEPENPVDAERIKELVHELEGELLIQKADEEIDYQKRRAESIEKMQQLIRIKEAFENEQNDAA